MAGSSGGAATALTTARALFGAVLLISPGPLLAALGGAEPDRAALAFARVLGARQLVEAGLLAHAPTPARLGAGAAIDCIHAATALALAERHHHRRLAAANAVSASVLALAGAVLARRRALGSTG